MKNKLFLLLIIIGCSNNIFIPNNFIYKEIKTDNFTIATWQKINNSTENIRIYIEGDGYAFNSKGYPTTKPTPKNKLVQDLAFKDPNKNVVYLARPCQFINDSMCKEKYWTTARFSNEIIDSIQQAIVGFTNDKQDIILIGYSGGAQIAGLLSQRIKIKKIITIAGVLDNIQWTNYHKLKPLTQSLNFTYDNSLNFQQLHFVGEKDTIVPPTLTQKIIKNYNFVIVPEATHNKGWEKVYDEIYK